MGVIANKRGGKHVLWELTNPIPVSSQGAGNNSSFAFLDKGNADVLFIGEGPGSSENLMGRPFIGRAGRLLRGAVTTAFSSLFASDKLSDERDKFVVAYSNLVACRPCHGNSFPNRQPTEQEVEACSPRLSAVIRALNPTGIVLCGRVPQLYFHGKILPVDALMIAHPAALLRRGGENAADYPQYVTDIQRFFADILGIGW